MENQKQLSTKQILDLLVAEGLISGEQTSEDNNVFSTPISDPKPSKITRLGRSQTVSSTLTKILLVILTMVGAYGWLDQAAVAPVVADAISAPIIEVEDTIAGRSTTVAIKNLTTGSATIALRSPNGVETIEKVIADYTDTAQLEIFPALLATAGEYQVRVVTEGYRFGKTTTFTVAPGEISTQHSTLTATSDLLASGAETSLKLKLVDTYSNPIANRAIHLLPTRGGDELQQTNMTTNEYGVITATYTPTQPGVIEIQAYDPERQQAVLSTSLTAYPQITKTYATNQRNQGGNYYLASILAANNFQIVDHFLIESPTSVTTGTPFSATIKAVDADNQIVSNYQGTVRFSSSDDAAVVPGDYTFMSTSGGQRTFDLGFVLNTIGTQSISVTDLDDPSITGQQRSISVNNKVSQDDANYQVGGDIPQIISPANNSNSNQATQIITGTAKPLSIIKVYDGTSNIGQTQANTEGKFSYTTEVLHDGQHQLSVIAIDEYDNPSPISNTISVNIDTSAAIIRELDLNPAISAPNQLVMVTLHTEQGLPKASVLVNNQITELRETSAQSGVFTGDILSPTTAGSYPIDVITEDEVGNEELYRDQATLIVETGSTEPTASSNYTGTINPPVTNPGTNNSSNDTVAPNPVSGVRVDRTTEHRIYLSWAPAQDTSGIKNYKVYYGTDRAHERIDTTINANTSWYVDGLSPATNYYLVVTAVDGAGNESVINSAYKVYATTKMLTAPAQPDTGSEVLVVVALALGLTIAISSGRPKKKRGQIRQRRVF